LSHIPAIFALDYSSGRVSSFCPGPSWDNNLPTFPYLIAEITAMHHHTWPVEALKKSSDMTKQFHFEDIPQGNENKCPHKNLKCSE
jgi:hypothetical protein